MLIPMDNFASLLSCGGLSYDRLINFCRIVEAGGLTKAAGGDLGKQSLYSRQVRELEEFFGVKLKRRQGKGIAITEAGHRLAQLARAHLLGLDEFKREALNMPRRLTIAAGNSILEWVLLPKLGALRAALPGTTLEFFNERTKGIVAKLVDMTLDIGLVRENSVVPPLKSRRLFATGYSLFIPRSLAQKVTADNLKARLKEIPLATSVGGQFRESLEAAAAKANWPLNIAVSCSSFTQAARAVHAGECGAVLPDVSADDLDEARVQRLALPFLRGQARSIGLVWNPRLVEVRGFLQSALNAIEASTRS